MKNATLAGFGIALLVIGAACHAAAAMAIGGTFVAWRDHMAGFVVATVIAFVIVAMIGRFFWRGRRDVTLFIVGALQFALGVYVWVTRFHMHG